MRRTARRTALHALRREPFDIRAVSYGGTAAVVTNMALVIGLDAATATKAAIASGLLIVAVADNLTTTSANYLTRLLLSLSFLMLVLLLPVRLAAGASVVWGMSLLTLLTYLLARQRGLRAPSEILKHLSIALAVIVASRVIGGYIALHLA